MDGHHFKKTMGVLLYMYYGVCPVQAIVLGAVLMRNWGEAQFFEQATKPAHSVI
jgi:hypothetical protein